MLFNSLEFFGFLTVVYVAYRILPFRWQNRMLLVAGYVFYGWWDVRFVFLIAFSTTVDFSIGLLMADRYMPARQAATRKTAEVSGQTTGRKPSGVEQTGILFLDNNADEGSWRVGLTCHCSCKVRIIAVQTL